MSANWHLRCSFGHVVSAPVNLPKFTTGWFLAASKEKMANGEAKLVKALVSKKEKAEEGWLRKLNFSVDPASASMDFVAMENPLGLQLTDQENKKL